MNSRSREKLIEFNEESFFSMLEQWPKGAPLLALGGNGSQYKLIALEFSEVNEDEFLTQRIQSAPPRQAVGLTTGYVACRAYEHDEKTSSRYFKVTKALQFWRDECFLIEDPKCAKNQYSYSLQDLAEFAKTEPRSFSYPSWSPKWSRQDYVSNVNRCLQDIRNGRYYQINLLQYYQLEEQSLSLGAVV